MDCLFVYGTLRSGYGHPLGVVLETEAKFLGVGYVHGYLYDLGEYPGIRLDPTTENRVIGEVYQLDYADQMFPEFDYYEGVSEIYSPEFPYRRVKGTVFIENEPYPYVWMYEYHGDTADLPQIMHGDYLVFLKDRKSK